MLDAEACSALFHQSGALNQIEAQFSYREEVRPCLNAFSYRACTVAVSEFTYLATHHSLKTIIGAA